MILIIIVIILYLCMSKTILCCANKIFFKYNINNKQMTTETKNEVTDRKVRMSDESNRK